MQLHTLISLLPRSTATLFSHHLVTVASNPTGGTLCLRTIAQPAEQKKPAQSKLLPFNAIRSDVQKMLLLPHFTPLQLQQSQMKELF